MSTASLHFPFHQTWNVLRSSQIACRLDRLVRLSKQHNVATSIKTCFHFAAIWAARARAHWPQSQTARSDKMKIKKTLFPFHSFMRLFGVSVLCVRRRYLISRPEHINTRSVFNSAYIYCVRPDKSVLWRRKSMTWRLVRMRKIPIRFRFVC